MIIVDDSKIQVVLDFIEKNDKIAFDVETTGLNVRKDTIIGFGISNATESFYIAHKSYNVKTGLKKLVSTNKCVQVLEALIGKKLIMFNGSFDSRFTLHYFGVDLIGSLWSDAMLAKHTVDENQPFRLKDIAKKLYGISAIEEQTLMKASIKSNGGSSKQYYKADLEIMGKYCEMDCLLTFRINEHYLGKLEKQGSTNFYLKDEVMPMYVNVVIPMELKGVRVDVEKLRENHIGILKDIKRIEREIQNEIKPLLGEFNKWLLWKDYKPARTGNFAQFVAEYAGMDLPRTATGKFSITKKNVEEMGESIYRTFLLGGSYLPDAIVKEIQEEMFIRDHGDGFKFNIKSKHHLKKLFFEKLEETPLSKTDKDNPQCNDDFLDSMATKYSWAEKIRIYNKLNKSEGTYIGKYLEENEDGIFYPSWFMHRTTSGRLGGDLMQLPRQLEEGESLDPLIEKYNNVIRDCIISGDGRSLVGADYASLEVVVFADDAGDEPLLEMIRNDEDFYSTVAIDVHELGDEYSANKKADNFLKKHKPKIRQDSKSYSLGLRYGLGDFALGASLGVDRKEASRIINTYFTSYPKLKSRMEEIFESSTSNGYVKSKGGRVRHLPLLKKLHYTYGDILMNGLDIWKKWGSSPAKYKQMKYLGRQYRDMVKNSYNFPIQSMAATICNKACIAISREFRRLELDAYIMMQLHDEIVVSCSDENIPKVKKIVQYLMENVTKLSVPLNAEPEVGVKYGDIK